MKSTGSPSGKLVLNGGAALARHAIQTPVKPTKAASGNTTRGFLGRLVASMVARTTSTETTAYLPARDSIMPVYRPSPWSTADQLRSSTLAPASLAASACLAAPRLLGEAKLLHEVAAIPEQPFVIHASVDPVTNRCHPDCEALPRGSNFRSVRKGHGPRECASHDARNCRPAARAKPDRMDLDRDIRGVDEEGFQILDVFGDPSRLMAVWPSNDDVLRVALLESIPFLVAEH